MRARTLIELLTLSSNLYYISKDKEFWEKVGEYTEKGKEKLDSVLSDLKDEDENSIIAKITQKAGEAKIEFEKKMEEVAVSVYKKMNIAHVDQINALQKEIDDLKKELSAHQEKLSKLEPKA